MTLSTYDPKDITVSVNGSILSGFSDDVVTVERAEDQVADVVGADGEVMRTLTNDRRGIVTISLLQTSASNLVLSVLANADEQTGGSVFPILIQDNRSGIPDGVPEAHAAAEAWIQKQPQAVYNKSTSPRVWIIRCADLRMVLAGHSQSAA